MPVSRRLLRLGLAALLALAALAAGALPAWRAVVGWASDSGRLEAWFNPRPERVRVSWRRLSSPWPGWLEVEGLRVAGRTPRLAWEVTAEHASGSIAPLPLLARELVFHGVRARGVTVHSSRFEVAARAAATGREVPAVEGFAAPAPPAGASPRLPWSFSFHDLEVTDLHELWIDDRRYTGTASGRGSFELRRRTFAEILDSAIDLRGVRLSAGGHEVARDLDGTLRFHVLPWRFRGAPAVEVARRFEGEVALRGEVAPDEALAYLFGDWPWLEIATEPSRLDADLRIHRGTFTPGSRLALESAVETLRFLGFEARGRAALSARVEGAWPEHPSVLSELRLDGWRLGRPGEEPFLLGDGLRLEAHADQARVDARPTGVELDLDLGAATLPDLTFLNASIPAAAGVAVAGGSARVGGRLRFTPGAPGGGGGGSGSLAVSADDLALRVGEDRWSGDLQADLRLTEPAFAPASFALAGSRVLLRDLIAPASAAGGAPAASARWWGELSLPEGRAVLARPFAATGRFAARLADSRPLVALYEMHRDLPDWAARLLTLQGLSVGGRYDWQPGRLELTDLVAPLPRGEVRGALELERSSRHGRLLAVWRGLAVGLELTPEGRRLHLRGARAWWAEQDRPPGAAGTP